MSATARLTGFTAILVAVFAGAALAGGAVDPDRGKPRAAHGENDTNKPAGQHGAGGQSAAHGGQPAARQVRGLAVAENGLRLVVENPELRRGRTEHVRFRIVDERGRTVRDFDVEHTKRMHLIVARRDLTGFQHLHPEQQRDGSWSVRLRLAQAGSYRLFADFSHKGAPATPATDLRVDGSANLDALPASSSSAISDGGYGVQLAAGRVRPGQEADLRFTITKDGRRIVSEPYLGAGGHLVALRDGDMAFLHVHPIEPDRSADRDARDDSIAFAATFPTAGRYRLFLQFKHAGRIQTVAFTQEVT